MAVEASLAGPRGLLLDLVRDGARAAAPEPRAINETLSDGAAERSADDDIRSWVNWYVGAAPVILRLLVLPAATVVLVGIYGATPLLPLVGVIAGLSVADLLALRCAAPRRARGWSRGCCAGVLCWRSRPTSA